MGPAGRAEGAACPPATCTARRNPSNVIPAAGEGAGNLPQTFPY
ncbi:hypothetical protein EPIB1_2779 [Tritonibacter mobilis]|nr:hypothetical protein EPIB1_2779 [Tritonibacter mobilis]